MLSLKKRPMLDKALFEFATIRYIPKVERGEFINIGAFLLCQEKNFLKLKYEIDEERLTVFSETYDLEMIGSYLQSWEAICAGSPQGGEIGKLELPVRFRWLTAPRSTIIQCSAVHSGLCTDPDKKLNDIFSKFVSSP